MFLVLSLLSVQILCSLMLYVNDKLLVLVLSSLISVSFCCLYVILNAPDVALTEAGIGLFLSSAILLFCINNSSEKVYKKNTKAKNIFYAIVFFIIFLIIFRLLNELEFFIENPFFNNSKNSLRTLYLDKSQDQIGVENVVTAVLASYRGFDTMLETYVIFITSFCVSFVFINIKNLSKYKNIRLSLQNRL
jgi:multicomponent Na+:H+ antiporter subunit B